MSSRVRTAGLAFALIISLTIPVAALGQTFTDHRQAVADQYGSPGSGGAGVGGAGAGQAGNQGNDVEGRGASRDDDDTRGDGAGRGRRGARGGDGRAEVSPDQAGARGGDGVLPLGDAQGGRLPFTGLDVGLIALLGVMLLVAGSAARVVARRGARGERTG